MMKTFESCRQAFHAAVASLSSHAQSELGREVRSKSKLRDLSLYMDMTYWPENPELLGLDDAEKARLQEWGKEYTQRLEAFHAKTEALTKQRHTALLDALKALGQEAGREFLGTTGQLDQRLADCLSKADQKRKAELDGIGYVSVIEDQDSFAKGFYGITKLKRSALFSDLKVCGEYRTTGRLLSHEELVRLGFCKETADESR